jgi:hypothetical protein
VTKDIQKRQSRSPALITDRAYVLHRRQEKRAPQSGSQLLENRKMSLWRCFSGCRVESTKLLHLNPNRPHSEACFLYLSSGS